MCSLHVVDANIDPTAYQDHLSDMTQRGGLLALLGSGISIWAPSELPAGQEITKALAERLVPASAAPLSTVRGLIERSAFEHIMFRYPKLDKLRMVLSDTFSAAPPNPVHESFARLIDRGVIEHIITTNYDSGLEEACATICRSSRQPQVVVTHQSAANINWSQPIIFKIHGCAGPGRSESIISNYEEEGELEEWKRILLRDLLRGRSLLVCGYSGYDFEICPELIAMTPYSIHWNCFENPHIQSNALTANARRLLNAGGSGATVIAGDMIRMLSVIDRPFTAQRQSIAADNFVTQLLDALLQNEPDDWEFDQWRVWVLNGTGCSSEGIIVGKEMVRKSSQSPQRMLDSLLALAEPLFHGGLYRQSAEIYRKAARVARNLGEVEKLIRAEVNAAECDRAAGYWLRAWFALRKVQALPSSLTDSERRKRMEGAVALKSVLLLQHVYQIIDQLHLSFLKDSIRESAKAHLKIVADASRKGSWFDFQHCEMLAKRFELALDEIYKGPLTPMPSRDGFRQLGYFIGEMMALRDELLKPGTVFDPSVFRNIDIAEEISCNSIVWKLSRAVARKIGRRNLPEDFKARWKNAWEACEYTLPMRLFFITLGRRSN